MQQVHFCSGSVFVTGDRIAKSLLEYVQTVAATHHSSVVTVPSLTLTGNPGTVTLMVNEVSQISAGSYEHAGAELEDSGFVSRLDALAHELTSPMIWLGEDHPAA